MPVPGDTGNGTTLTFAANMGFGTATTSMICTTIEAGGWSKPMIAASTLATSGSEEMIPGDLHKPKRGKATFKWLTTAGTAAMYCNPTNAGTGSIVITSPLRSGETTAANYTGTGAVVDFTLPTYANGQLQEGSIEWEYDGDTDPAWTGAT